MEFGNINQIKSIIKMKKHISLMFLFIGCFTFHMPNLLYAQDNVAIVTPTTEAGENLDLMGILELFYESETLEDF